MSPERRFIPQNNIENTKSLEEKVLFFLNLNDSTVFPNNILPVKYLDPCTKHVMEHHYNINEKGEVINHYYGINKEKLNQENSADNKLLEKTLHEVRHRVQLEKNINLFSKEDIESYPIWLQEKIKILPKEINGNEYDTKVTEYILMYLFNKGLSVEEVSKLLGLGSEDLLDKIN